MLRQAIPGCEEIDQVSDTELAAKVKAKVGPVSAKFAGNVTLSDLDPPNGYTISGEGKGGPAGFAKGGATVNLAEDAGETVLTYEAKATVGGKLAQIGSRLIDSTAKKQAEDFFGKFAEVVGGPAQEAAPATEAPAVPAAGAAPAQAAPSGGGLSPAVWIGGLVAIVVVVLIIVLS